MNLGRYSFPVLLLLTACRATPQEPPAEPRTITVNAGGDLQAAINQANLGDTILLENGAVFEGNLFLSSKPGEGWIEIRPVNTDFLPGPNERITKAHFAQMPKLLTNNTDPALGTFGAAHHYRITGIEFGVVPGRWNWNIVNIGTAQEKNLVEFPHHIEFDRVYVHGDPEHGSIRGFALNGGNLVVKNSHISDFKRPNLDTQAIASWNTPGHIQIINNYLEGAAENIILGGAPPSILNMVPSDIEIRRNHFFKPLSWRAQDPSFAGTAWSVKNLFEIKMGRRITLDSNILEHAWQHHQLGFAIVLTVRTENAQVPQAVVEDIQITNNIIRKTGCGVNFLGVDDWDKGAGLGKTRRVTLRNNLIHDVGGEWGCGARMFQILHNTEEITIDHNTIIQTGGSLLMAEGAPHQQFKMTNNILSYASYGAVGTGIPNGDRVLAHYFPNAQIVKNVIVGTQPNLRPADNIYVNTYDDIKFVDSATHDYRLSEDSSLRGRAGDDTDPGANIEELVQATAGVIKGIPADQVPAEEKLVARKAAPRRKR
jgi:hypothetical protein